jgi:hypothetical protein
MPDVRDIVTAQLASEVRTAEHDMKSSIETLKRMLMDYEENPEAAITPGNLTRTAALVETAQMRFKMAKMSLKFRELENEPPRSPLLCLWPGDCQNQREDSSPYCAKHNEGLKKRDTACAMTIRNASTGGALRRCRRPKLKDSPFCKQHSMTWRGTKQT